MGKEKIYSRYEGEIARDNCKGPEWSKPCEDEEVYTEKEKDEEPRGQD